MGEGKRGRGRDGSREKYSSIKAIFKKRKKIKGKEKRKKLPLLSKVIFWLYLHRKKNIFKYYQEQSNRSEDTPMIYMSDMYQIYDTYNTIMGINAEMLDVWVLVHQYYETSLFF